MEILAEQLNYFINIKKKEKRTDYIDIWLFESNADYQDYKAKVFFYYYIHWKNVYNNTENKYGLKCILTKIL